MISLCISWRLRFMYCSVLYQWSKQHIEWTPFCTRLRLALWSDIHICIKGHFRLNRELMQGLILMTDYSCKKFCFGVEDNLFCLRILNDGTFFLKEGNIARNITVYWFGMCSSVWCRAKIFDLDQAAFSASWSSWPHCSFMYESFQRETTLWHFETA